MIRKIYDQIINNTDVRKNLIELKKLIKEPSYNNELYFLTKDKDIFFETLLTHEDPKVRKNIALIIGELGREDFMDRLYKAYKEEEKLFVKNDYLIAISKFEYNPLLTKLEEALNALNESVPEESAIKHTREQIKTLTTMIYKINPPKKHIFKGDEVPSEVVLLTEQGHQEVTLNQLPKDTGKVFNAGIIAKTNDLRELSKIRTYKDLFFRLPSVYKVPNEPIKAAHMLMDRGFLEFLETRHLGDGSYHFRIELKTRRPLDEKSKFTKKMAQTLEERSNRRLLNSTSHYEVELRLIENKEGALNVLIKLYTFNDERFSYRKNALSESIAPDRAALIVELAKEYMKSYASVLDPFCGVGTLLIERSQVALAEVMYGVDLYGEAIDGAIENSDLAEVDIYLVTKNFFEFTHKYQFDEILTDMPTATGRKTKNDIAMLYKQFFDKVDTLLKEKGIMILYSRDLDFIQKEVKENTRYSLLKTISISRKEASYLCILNKR